MKTITVATSVILLASFWCWKRSQEVVELLIVVGVDSNTMSDFHKTPLDVAIQLKRTELADLLRKHGGKTGAELKAQGK